MNQAIITSCIRDSLLYAQSQDYRSNDVSDLLRTGYHRYTKKLENKKLKTLLQYPYNYVISHYPNFVRAFIKDKNFIYPQGQAMVIRALVALAKKENILGDIEEAKKIADWLISNKSPLSKHHGWGQPFLWYSRIPFPPNTPRATVSSQVAWAMLDLFEYTEDSRYLEVAVDICMLFMNEFNFTPDKDGDFCLSYTTLDNFHVHNSSMLAASAMMRVFKHTANQQIGNFAIKLSNFTKKHQNEDGSFYYWALPNKLIYKIDNYHTGFVLESFHSIKDDCGQSCFDKVYDIGMDFYYKELFEGPIPKMTNKSTYPVDIQSCAQSIMTFAMSENKNRFYLKARDIAKYTIENFYLHDKKHFAYKIHGDGRIDKSYYFRWGDAWMIRALSYLI